MNRRLFASVALSFTSLAFGANLTGCSAGPGEDVGATHDALAEKTAASGGGGGGASITCTTPLTTPSELCAPIAGRIECSPYCKAVTQTPTPTPSWTRPLPTPTPIAPPAALAALGCTWGVEALYVRDGNIWACPASVAAKIPGTLGTLSCPPFRYLGEPACEIVTEGSTVGDNPVVGNPDPGWILVQDSYSDAWPDVDGGVIGGGCAGGCTIVNE